MSRRPACSAGLNVSRLALLRSEKYSPAMKTAPLDPQELLPLTLRKRWLLIPKSDLHLLALNMVLIGAGLGIGIVGFIQGHRTLQAAFPVALLLAMLIRKIASISDARDRVALDESYPPQ